MLHVDIPTRADLQALFLARDRASVTIYLPTTPVSVEVEPSRIELGNLADLAAQQLHDGGIDKRAIAAVVLQLDDLLDDPALWAMLANSLAVFVTPERIRTFRLPSRIGSLVEVSDRFHLKPLLRSVTFPNAAFLLALSQGSARLLEISPDLPTWEVKVEGMPRDAASAVGKSSLADRATQGRLQGSEGQKVRMAQYARLVDGAIRPLLAGMDLPLILAAPAPLDAIFRSVNTYPHLVEEGIRGNPDATADAELAEAARPILDRLYAADLAAVRSRFDALVSRGRAAADIVDVARAATFGAVDTVLVDIDRVVPGSVDETSGKVTFEERDNAVNYGVVDEIARRTFLAGGRVMAVRREDIPGESAVAALLRYPV